jgi:predicted nucleic acid-binding protein
MCDTNIPVRAVISPYGAAAELVRMVAKDHSLVTSSYVLAEPFEVLRRPKIRQLHNLHDEKIRRAVSRFYKLSAHVSLPSPLPEVVPRSR